ncbi:MAG: cell division protein ZipA [Flavobacteriales bacterium]
MDAWLKVIVIILIVGIVLDGLRRARKNSQGKVKLSRNVRRADIALARVEKIDKEKLNTEFPSGGARSMGSVGAARKEYKEERPTVKRENSASSESIKAHDTFNASHNTENNKSIKPEQENFDFDEAVPMLMDSIDSSHSATEAGEVLSADQVDVADMVDEVDEVESTEAYASDKQLYQEQVDQDMGVAAQVELNPIDDGIQANHDHVEPSLGSFEDVDLLEEPVNEGPFNQDNSTVRKPRGDDSLDFQVQASGGRFSFAKNNKKENIDEAPKLDASLEQVHLINVMAKTGCLFNGEDIEEAFFNVKLRFGQMKIFHRHENDDGDAMVKFSVANMLEPGSFNLVDIKTMQTPGLCFFLTLPAKIDAINAYDDMAATAKAISQYLDGVLRDENRNIMTRQSIGHSRQRVVEYERQKKLIK